MSDLAEAESPVRSLPRDRSGVQRVTNIEPFFDLVYVFAITQLSHPLHTAWMPRSCRPSSMKAAFMSYGPVPVGPG
jgi:low temperature requirement protein LtrA